MRVKSLTFALERTMPLKPISGKDSDEYANIKPSASITIEFDADDPSTLKSTKFKDTIETAFTTAANEVLKQMQDFSKEFRELYKKPREG